MAHFPSRLHAGGIWATAPACPPRRDDALGVDDSLPRHVVVVEAGPWVLREVLQADAHLARPLGWEARQPGDTEGRDQERPWMFTYGFL